MKKNLFVVFLMALGLLISCDYNKPPFLKATDELVFTQGRVAEVEEGSLDFAYPGVSFEIKVKAKAVYAVLMDVNGSGNNYFNVVVDGNVVKTLQVSKEKKSYLLADELDDSAFHTVQLFKRTESFVGVTRFYGFEFAKYNEATTINKPTKKLLIIGDSFSCGYGNGVEITAEQNPEVGFHAENENNYMAYGAVAARKLDYQYQCIAYSGKGMYRNFDLSTQKTLPEIFPFIFPDSADGGLWHMNKYVPDVIVVKLGTNDFFGEARNPIQAVDSLAFVTAYRDFLTQLKDSFPKAQFVCVVGGMMSDSFPAERQSLTKIRSYVNAVVKKANHSRKEQFHFLEFPQHHTVFGEDWHPTANWHQLYGELLATEIAGL